jgi:hypothetical protein
MKKSYILSLFFIYSLDISADTGEVCIINAMKTESSYDFIDEIESNCKTDDILYLHNQTDLFLPRSIAWFCRFDREISTFKTLPEGTNLLVCQLKSNKRRKYLY